MRPVVLTEKQEREVVDAVLNTDLTLQEIGKKYGISTMKIYGVQVKYGAFRKKRNGQGNRDISRHRERIEAELRGKVTEPLKRSLAGSDWDAKDWARRWTETITRLLEHDAKARRRMKMHAETYTDYDGAMYRVWDTVKAGKTGYGICFKSPGNNTKWRPWSKVVYEKAVDAFAVLRDEATHKGWWRI